MGIIIPALATAFTVPRRNIELSKPPLNGSLLLCNEGLDSIGLGRFVVVGGFGWDVFITRVVDWPPASARFEAAYSQATSLNT